MLCCKVHRAGGGLCAEGVDGDEERRQEEEARRGDEGISAESMLAHLAAFAAALYPDVHAVKHCRASVAPVSNTADSAKHGAASGGCHPSLPSP